jgi:hypothetical protein
VQHVVPLVLLAIGLISTNRSVTFVDDESTIVGAAAAPLRTLLAGFFSGAGHLDHPPLYDILLHLWMRGTGGNIESHRCCFLLRPSIYWAGPADISPVPKPEEAPLSGWERCGRSAFILHGWRAGIHFHFFSSPV